MPPEMRPAPRATRPRALIPLFLLVLLAIAAIWRCARITGAAPAGRGDESAATAGRPQAGEGSESGLAAVSTADEANKRLGYFYYFPTSLRRRPEAAHPVLVIVPGLSGRITGADPATWGKAARKNGWIILSPHFIFASEGWRKETSYQFPAAWSGQAMLDILDDFSSRQGLRLGPCFLHGVSAGAQFAVRFALWRPDLCRAVAAHAGGGTITPVARVPVSFYITIGRDDLTRRRQFDWFLRQAAEKGISVRSRIYPGGHGLPREQILDSIRFFEETPRLPADSIKRSPY